jgi:nitrate reductase gamma subunit
MENSSMFVLWPYLAFGLFGAGVVVRYLLALRHPSALQAELADAKTSFSGRAWWISVSVLLAGHLAGLLFPMSVMTWNASAARLYVLEAVAGLAGVTAVLSGAMLILQHLRRPAKSLLTELFDTVLLGFLFAGIASGVLTAVFHRWGSSWGVTILTPYVMSLLRGRPAPELAAQMPFLVRLHILCSYAALAVVPLTRLSTFAVVALHKCVVFVSRPVRVGAAAANTWLVRHNPSAWFWPEED